jgi:hypothetical protein
MNGISAGADTSAPSAATTTTCLNAADSSIQADAATDKDAPLFADIRLLGRLLGDVIRDQEGEAVFAIVERIRLLSISLHRDDNPGTRRTRRTAQSPDAEQTNWWCAQLLFHSPTSPRTSITPAARVPTRWPARSRAKAFRPWLRAAELGIDSNRWPAFRPGRYRPGAHRP